MISRAQGAGRFTHGQPTPRGPYATESEGDDFLQSAATVGGVGDFGLRAKAGEDGGDFGLPVKGPSLNDVRDSLGVRSPGGQGAVLSGTSLAHRPLKSTVPSRRLCSPCPCRWFPSHSPWYV
jgi:hypothetical protein